MKRMHKDGLKVLRLRGIIFSLIVALFGIGSTASAYFFDWGIVYPVMIVSAVLVVLAIIFFICITPKYRYAIFRYQFDTHKLFVQKGLFFVKQYKAPLYRIQNVEIEEGWIMRRFNLANILLYTAGGVIQVKLIHKEEAQKLNVFIKQHGMMELYDGDGYVNSDVEATSSHDLK